MTIDERQRLASSALTVFERAALAGNVATSKNPLSQREHAAYLRSWIQVFSPGDPVAFERRLTWDGLDLSTVTRGLSLAPFSVPAADWLSSIDQILAVAPSVADELTRGPLPEADLFDEGTPPPFLELLVPSLRVSRAELHATTPVDRTLALTAVQALERQLLRDLAALAALAMLDHFKVVRATESEGYAAFTERMLSGALTELFLSYPALARQMVWTMRQWVTTTTELVRRLEADAAALAREFGHGADLGRVQSLVPALSDPHNGGRRVVALHFESGRRLIYKPRHVGLEWAFGKLVAWATARGLEPYQRVARVLDRRDYGWVEHVAQEPFSTSDEVRRYYRKAGGLLCLAHVLSVEDLHMENVVATRDGPVLIDLELMLQPAASDIALNGLAAGQRAEHDERRREHCLASSLLTFIQANSGQLFDMGGLRGTGRGPSALARRVWRGLGTDAIDCVDEWTFEAAVSNQVVLDGRPQRPDDYADEMCGGFEDTYRFLLTHRDELRAPNGPLAHFSGCASRVLLRSTHQYGLLRHVLARPQYLRDGRRWSSALDALNRTFSQFRERPAVWPVAVAERDALQALDIPHFTVMTDETMVRAAGKPVMDGYFKQCGLSRVTQRFERLSTADLQGQLEHLARALRESVHTRFRSKAVLDQPGAGDEASDGFLIAHAAWIGRELLLQREQGHDGRVPPFHPATDRRPLERHYLYDGSVGLAIFLSALTVATGDDAWRGVAREVLTPLATAVDCWPAESTDGAIGGASGLGSVIYGLTVAGTLLDDAAVLDVAGRVASRLSDAHIESDTALDVLSGTAGALLGLLALYRVTGETRLLARAIRCGAHLCDTRVVGDDGVGWRTANNRVLTGFAHGAAGIAYALGQLFDVTGDARFGRTAAEGYRRVAACFLPGLGNWSVVDTSTPGGRQAGGTPLTMTAWCNGAAGMALAVALSDPALIDARLIDQRDRAVGTIAAALPHRADHVCCGNMGRAEALVTLGHRLRRPEAIDAGRRTACDVVGRARTRGHFCLTSDPFLYRVWDPGFFRGLSGIGYALLHVAVPSRLPSIVAFEARPLPSSLVHAPHLRYPGDSRTER